MGTNEQGKGTDDVNIAVYCGSSPLALEPLKEAARQLGTWIGKSGHALVYGGSSIGLMGEVSASTLSAGGEVFGVEPQFFIDAGVAQHDLTRLHVVQTMEERKALMIELADVFVALPGGVGTLEEISEIMSRIRLQMTPGPCYFLDLDGFYEGLRSLLRRMVKARFIEEEHVDRGFIFADTTRELIALLEMRSAEACPACGYPVVPESNIARG